MITTVSKKELLKSGEASPLYARIYTAFFNKRSEFDGVYIQKDEADDICALLSVNDNKSALITKENADLTEIKSFFKFNGVNSVTTLDKKAAVFLFSNVKSYSVLKLCAPLSDGCLSIRLTPEADLNTYRMLYSCIATPASVGFDGFYTDFSARIFNNYADGFYIKEHDKIVSCALSPTVADTAAIISGVKTLEEFRGRGFAGDCVKRLYNSLLFSGVENIFLWCEDCRISFYENLGFEKISNIYIGR